MTRRISKSCTHTLARTRQASSGHATSAENEKKREEADLKKKLEDLLKPSWTHQDLEDFPRSCGSLYRQDLRMTSEALDIGEWKTKDSSLHNGAQFPLIVFTHNASARSLDAADRRRQKSEQRRQLSQQYENHVRYVMFVQGPGQAARIVQDLLRTETFCTMHI